VVIFDTNIWISYSLFPASSLSSVVAQTISITQYAMSDETFSELVEVLLRPKFDRFVSLKSRQATLGAIAYAANWFTPDAPVEVCRDPSDNKFLALAMTCRADYLITGDEDLLILDPFYKTRILNLSEFSSIE
jgi:putative PIN family toxin of toxin-antitoxin system